MLDGATSTSPVTGFRLRFPRPVPVLKENSFDCEFPSAERELRSHSQAGKPQRLTDALPSTIFLSLFNFFSLSLSLSLVLWTTGVARSRGRKTVPQSWPVAPALWATPASPEAERASSRACRFFFFSSLLLTAACRRRRWAGSLAPWWGSTTAWRRGPCARHRTRGRRCRRAR